MALRLHRTGPAERSGYDRIEFQLPPQLVADEERGESLFQQFRGVYETQERVVSANVRGAESWLPVEGWAEEGRHRAHYLAPHCDLTGEMFLGEKEFSPRQCHRLATQLVQALQALEAAADQPHGDLLLPNGDLNREVFAFARHRRDRFGRLLLTLPLAHDQVSGPAKNTAQRRDLRAIGAFIRAVCCDRPAIFGKQEKPWRDLLQDLGSPSHELSLAAIAARLAALRPRKSHPMLWAALALATVLGTPLAVPTVRQYLRDLFLNPMPYYKVLLAWDSWLAGVSKPLAELQKIDPPPTDTLRALRDLDIQQKSWNAYDILDEAEKDDVEGMEPEADKLKSVDARKLRRWVRGLSRPERKRLDALVAKVVELDGYFAEDSALASDLLAARDALPMSWQKPRAYLGVLATQSNPEKARRRAAWLARAIRAIRTAREIARAREDLAEQIGKLTAAAGESVSPCDSQVVPKLRDWFDSLGVSQGKKGTADDLENAGSQIERGAPDRKAFDRLREAVTNVVKAWEGSVDLAALGPFEDGLAKAFPDVFRASDGSLPEASRYLELFEKWENEIPRKEDEMQWWTRMSEKTDRPTSIAGLNAIWREYRKGFLGDRPVAGGSPSRYGSDGREYLAAKDVLDEFKTALLRISKEYERFEYVDGSVAIPVSGPQGMQRNWKKCRESLENFSATRRLRAYGEGLDAHGLPTIPKDAATTPDPMLTEYRRGLETLDQYFSLLGTTLAHMDEFSSGKLLVPGESTDLVEPYIASAERSFGALSDAMDRAETKWRGMVASMDGATASGTADRANQDAREMKNRLLASIRGVSWLKKGIGEVGELQAREAAARQLAKPRQGADASALLDSLVTAAEERGDLAALSRKQRESARQALRVCAWWKLGFPEQDEKQVLQLAEAVWEHVQTAAGDDETVLTRFQALRQVRARRGELATALSKAWPTSIPDPDPTVRSNVGGRLAGWVWAEFRKSKVDAPSLDATVDALSGVVRTMADALADAHWDRSPGINGDALNEYAPLAGKLSEKAFQEWAEAVPGCVRLFPSADGSAEAQAWKGKVDRLEPEYRRLNQEYGGDYPDECRTAKQALDRVQDKVKGAFQYHLVERNRTRRETETKSLEKLVAEAEVALDAIMSPEKWLAKLGTATLRPPRQEDGQAGQPALALFERRWEELRGQLLEGKTAENLTGEANRIAFRQLRADVRAVQEQLRKADGGVPITVELTPRPEADTETEIQNGLKKTRDALLATFLASAETREPAYWRNGKWTVAENWRRAVTGLAAARDLASQLPQQLLTAGTLLDGFRMLDQKDKSGTSLAGIRRVWQPGPGAESSATGTLLREVTELQALLSRMKILAEIGEPATKPAKLVVLAQQAGQRTPERFAAWERLGPASGKRWPRDKDEWQTELTIGDALGKKLVGTTVAPRFSEERRQRWHRALRGTVPPAAVFRGAARFGVSGDESFAAWREPKRAPEGVAGLNDDIKLARELWGAKPWQGVAGKRWAKVFSEANNAGSILELATGKQFEALRTDDVVVATMDDRELYNLRLARMKMDAGALAPKGAGGAPDPRAKRELELWLGAHVGGKPEGGDWPDTTLGKLAKELWEKASADEKEGGASGLDKAGPAREEDGPGWQLAAVSYGDGQEKWTAYDGAREPDWVKYAKGARSLVFRKVEADGKSSYVCTTESSIEQVLQALGVEEQRWSAFWETVHSSKLRKAAAGGNLTTLGKAYGKGNTILCWQPVDETTPVQLEAREDWFDSLWEVWTEKRDKLTGWASPSEQDPARWLGPTTCAYVASLYGCRLPTGQEWRAAAALGDNPRRNSRGRSWHNCYQILGDEKLLDGGTDPSATPLVQGTFSIAQDGDDWQAGETDDGVLWFSPVGATDDRKLWYVLDNVAEFVCRDAAPLDDWLKDAKRPAAALAGALRDSVRIAGGSALSPPGYCKDDHFSEVTGLGPATGYSDVGFRLAFSASPPSPGAMVAKIVEDADYGYPDLNP